MAIDWLYSCWPQDGRCLTSRGKPAPRPPGGGEEQCEPEALRFAIAVEVAQKYQAVCWVDGALGYLPHWLADPQWFTPTLDQWRAFWQEVDQLGAWEWKPSYDPSPDVVIDGISWGLEMEYRGSRVVTVGSNGYPGGRWDDMGPVFYRFLAAVDGLIGGRRFRGKGRRFWTGETRD